jgi:hypothetical protein
VARRHLVGVGVLVAGGALAACGTKEIKAHDLEEKIRGELGARAGALPRSVDCPDGVESDPGKKFDCRLTAPNGDVLRVEVTVKDEDGNVSVFVPPQQGQ